MKNRWKDIKEKTSGMGRKEALAYIFTYYWYHMLAFVSVAALIFLFAAHYGSGNKKPLFTCMIVNQQTDAGRDLRIRDAFAQYADILPERVVIDSGCQFSYGQFRIQGVNESSYEKFFFQWGNHEIDAVIMPESFYRHCREMGGDFYVLDGKDVEGMELYMDEGQAKAAVLGEDRFMETAAGEKGGKLLLAFPVSGERTQMRNSFLKFVSRTWKDHKEGIWTDTVAGRNRQENEEG